VVSRQVPSYADLRLQRKTARESRGAPLFEAGVPGGPVYGHPLPRGKFVVAKGPPELFPQEYGTSIDTDAAYDPSTRSRGLAWILTVAGDSEIREGWYDREGGGNNCAEISAIVGGMTRARAEGRKRILIRTDNRLASHIITRADQPRLPRVVELAACVSAILPSFEAVAVAWCPEKQLKEVDRLSRLMIRRRTDASGADSRAHLVERFGRGHALRGVEVREFSSWMALEERFP
jgi:ribonuclease HI